MGVCVCSVCVCFTIRYNGPKSLNSNSVTEISFFVKFNSNCPWHVKAEEERFAKELLDEIDYLEETMEKYRPTKYTDMSNNDEPVGKTLLPIL